MGGGGEVRESVPGDSKIKILQNDKWNSSVLPKLQNGCQVTNLILQWDGVGSPILKFTQPMQ